MCLKKTSKPAHWQQKTYGKKFTLSLPAKTEQVWLVHPLCAIPQFYFWINILNTYKCCIFSWAKPDPKLPVCVLVAGASLTHRSSTPRTWSHWCRAGCWTSLLGGWRGPLTCRLLSSIWPPKPPTIWQAIIWSLRVARACGEGRPPASPLRDIGHFGMCLLEFSQVLVLAWASG